MLDDNSQSPTDTERGQMSPVLPRGWTAWLLLFLVVAGILNFVLPEVLANV